MGSERRRNHFVPKMLLKKFTDEDGRLYFFDRRFEEKRILKTTPDAICWKRDLYVVRDEGGNRDDSAEDKFAELERKAARVLDKIITAVRDGKAPALNSSEKEILDRYVYFQWARVPDTADPIVDHTLEKLSLKYSEIADLPPEKRAELGKGLHVESLADMTEPGEGGLSIFGYRSRAFEFLRNKSLAFVGIRRKNKSFVIGSRPVVQVFPEHSDSAPLPFLAVWLPLAHDVAVAYGEGEGGLMEFTEDRELRRFNETVFKQSKTIAGRSERLIASLAGVAVRKAGRTALGMENRLF